MSYDMNSVNLIGRLGRDPEVKTTNAGDTICNFSIAVNTGKDKSIWVNITCFKFAAEFASKNLTKGRKVSVSGRLAVDEYTNKEGQKVTKTYVIAQDVSGLDKAEGSPAPAVVSDDEDEEDPFKDD